MNWKNSSKLSSLVDAGLHSRQPSSLSKVVGLGAEPRASCMSDKLSTTKPCPQFLVQGVWCSQKHFCFIGAKEFSILHLLDASSLCRISNRGKKHINTNFLNCSWKNSSAGEHGREKFLGSAHLSDPILTIKIMNTFFL